MKKIVLLGATGSIGTQTIDVVKHHRDEFHIVAIAAGNNIAKLEELLIDLPDVHTISVAQEDAAKQLQEKYPQYTVLYGEEGLKALAQLEDYDVFVNAIVGFRGLVPTLCAIENKRTIALANKETLVAGGVIVKDALKKHGVTLYPIDSEHSAIFQCLQGNAMKDVSRLIVTASGGSFRHLEREQLHDVTPAQALKHPNWNMGGRITIDSATMMNKGFEVIEAHYLFDLPYDKIDVLIHEESIIHSMVEYQDHAIIAQLGSADMRIPIQYALSYPNRLEMHNDEPFNFLKYPALHFREASFERYPLLALAYEVGRKEGNLGAIMNAADEMAVELFLKGKISFLDIESSIIKAVKELPYIEHPTLEDLLQSDAQARVFVKNLWEGDCE